jgi:hypothetical protein
LKTTQSRYNGPLDELQVTIRVVNSVNNVMLRNS